MNDYIVRATAADHSIRAFAITSKNIVEEARKDHNTSPVITAALGRLLSGAAMMGTMMKGEKDLLTVQIQCQGPAQGLTVTADSAGHVKGFPRVADVELPPNVLGKLDVGGALGLGVMSVIKDIGLCGTDRTSDRRDRRGFNLLFCDFGAGSFRSRTGCFSRCGRFCKAGRRIYHPADAVYTGRSCGCTGEKNQRDRVCD